METYSVVIHEDPEGGFWAEVPALPGCYSQGESMPELMDNIREAIAVHFEPEDIPKQIRLHFVDDPVFAAA